MNASALRLVASNVSPRINPDQRTGDWWMDRSEEFTRLIFGQKVNLQTSFVTSALPWVNPIPVYDPGDLSTVQVLRLVRSLLNINMWEGFAGRHYNGSEPSGVPRPLFTGECKAPTPDTLGKTTMSLRMDGKPYMQVRHYAIAYGLYYFATSELWDTESVTGFPSDVMPGPGMPWSVSFQTVFAESGPPELRCSRYYIAEADPIRGSREVIYAIPLSVVV